VQAPDCRICQEGPTEPGFSLETEQVKLRAALGAYIDADLTSAASDSGLRTAVLGPLPSRDIPARWLRPPSSSLGKAEYERIYGDFGSTPVQPAV
jgi:hypothetical protein